MILKGRLSRNFFNKYQAKRGAASKPRVSHDLEINALYRNSLFISGFLGVVFVLFYYLPIYRFPEFFNQVYHTPEIGGYRIAIRWIRDLDNLILTFIELYLLSILSMIMVNRLCQLYDFPPIANQNYELHKQNVLALSLEKRHKKELELGLNPYEGLPRSLVLGYLAINRIKGILSSLMVRMVLQRFFGRSLLKFFIDMTGIPIYAFWNAYSTAQVFKKTKYYILSVQLTDYLTERLQKDAILQASIRGKLEEILGTIVLLKRDFSPINHYFAHRLIQSSNHPWEIQETRGLKKSDLEGVSNPTELHLIGLIIATGFILDGKISRSERRKIQELHELLGCDLKIFLNIDEYLIAYRKGKATTFLVEHSFI
jgi:hypothetical protein